MVSRKTLQRATIATLATTFSALAIGAVGAAYDEAHPSMDPEGLKPANVQVADRIKDNLDDSCTNWSPAPPPDCGTYDTSTLTQVSFNSAPSQNPQANPGENTLSFVFTVLSKDHTQQTTLSGHFETLGQDKNFTDVYPTAITGGVYGISSPQPVATARLG